MKKLFAIVLCFAVLFTLSATIFAESPQAEPTYTVILRKGTGVSGIGATDSSTVVTEGDIISATPNTTYGTFDNWTIFKRNADGTTAPAISGTDYELQDGTTLSSSQIKLKAKADIIICANYDNLVTDPLSASSVAGSPKTADMSIVYVAIMLAAAVVVLGAKKVYSK